MINNIIEKLTEGLNDEQKQAVENPINSCTQIVAGAGTGKTKIISKRYIKLVQDLLEQGVENPLEHILVITFTEKAATEMKERIVKELQANNIDYFGQEIWISTIHSFCSKILRTHSIEANLSPTFKLGDEKELADIFDMIIKKITYNEYKTIENVDYIAKNLGIDSSILSAENLNKLNKINNLDEIFAEILPIIKKIKSFGKTPADFMENSINSINNFTETLKTLPLTFSSKGDLAIVWKEYLKNYTCKGCDFYEIKESEKTHKISYGGNYDDITKAVYDSRRGNPDKWTIREGILDDLDEINKSEIYLTQIIALVYAIYQNELEKRDLADFDDLINKTLYILKNNEDIRHYYQDYFKQLIIDEFQDTNGAQLELLSTLLPQDAPNITFVGDEKQSIYGFRYAQKENLRLLCESIKDKYGEKISPIKLKYNYRSTPQVLEAVNHITDKELKLNEFLSANPTIEFEPIQDSVKTSVLTGYSNANEYRILEAKYIASEIIKAKKEHELAYKDFAVLVKTHSDADILEEELMKYGIPSVKKSNSSYFQKTVIRNVQSLLRLANNMRDEISLVRILSIKLNERQIFKLKSEVDKSTYKDDVKILNLNEKILKLLENDVFKNLKIDEDTKNYVSKIFDILFAVSEKKRTSTLIQIYFQLLKEIPMYYGLPAIEKMLAEIDLAIFEKIIMDFMQNESYVSIKNFNEYIERIKNDRTYEFPDIANTKVDAVKLMTVHASKGLEFPYVFVANMTKSIRAEKSTVLFDLTQGNENNSFGVFINSYNGIETLKRSIYGAVWYKYKQQEEQCRLFYVAASRAKTFLNIIHGINTADFIADMPFATPIIDVNDIEVEKQDFEYKFFKQNSEIKEVFSPKTLDNTEKTYKMSFSKLNMFNHCKNKFLLKYRYCYPEISTNSKDLSFVGSAVHNMIYNSYLNKKSFDESEMENFLNDVEIAQTEKDEILSIYKNFKTSDYSPERIQNYLTEYSFNFSYGDVKFFGDIDLVIKNNDESVTIVDFKTNKNIEKSIKDYAKQVYIYKKALSENGFNVKDTVLLNLKPEGAKEITISEEDLISAKEKIEADINFAIKYQKDGTFDNKEFHNCKTCGYNYICRR